MLIGKKRITLPERIVMDRYKILQNLVIQPITDSEKVLVINKSSGKTYEIGKREAQVLSLLDGKKTEKEISEICGFFTENEIRLLEQQLCKAGLCSIGQTKTPINILKLKISILCPDKIFNNSNRIRFFYYLQLIFCLGGMLLGTIGCINNFIGGASLAKNDFAQKIAEQPFSGLDIAVIYMIILVSFILHEFAHMITARRYGINVPDMGLMLYLFVPCAYTNLSFVNYCKSDKNKIHILSAGLMMDLGVMGMAMFLFYMLPICIFSKFCLYIVLFSIIAILGNLSIFFKFDGYYIFEVLLKENSLKEKSMQAMVMFFKKCGSMWRNRGKKLYAWSEGRKQITADVTTMFYLLFCIVSFLYVPILISSGILPLIVSWIGGK